MQVIIIKQDAEIIGAPGESGHNAFGICRDSDYDFMYNSMERKVK